ncbi:hypothetical protein PanWU01x14_106670 [Parasponia andersonii]|uniref:Uncharacterized protein n=1 Tax=Parasponia andersonii TaxID=3476 RepID=A0A2P5D0Q7_PARAD|nr:hypothetical protein PanWU01x14_106670 [Parasponia andersonii]
MGNVDPNLCALLSQNRACEGSGRNSPSSSSWLTSPRTSLPLQTSELFLALTTRTPSSSGRSNKRPMDTPHPDEPSFQHLKTFLKRPIDMMHVAYSE